MPAVNGYSYANNNPTTLSDPDGLRPCAGDDDCRFGDPVTSNPRSGACTGTPTAAPTSVA
jgi:hypothetical protein